MGKGGGGLLPIVGERPKPKSLIEAISDIQMYANLEREGQVLPGTYLLLRERMSFMEVGLKGGLVSALVSGLTLPISVAVIERLFPIFGTTSPSGFDQVFAIVLSVSFQLGYQVMTAKSLAACYLGAWCQRAIRSLYGGLLAGKALVLIGLFWLYHELYFLLTPARLAEWAEGTAFLQKLLLLDPGSIRHLEDWILRVRHALLISSWLMLVLTSLTMAIALAIFTRGKRRAQQELARRQRYLKP